MIFSTKFIEQLNSSLPPIFARKEVKKLFGGSISSGTLANLAVTGDGPPYVKTGRHVIYERESFLDWFKTIIKQSKPN